MGGTFRESAIRPVVVASVSWTLGRYRRLGEGVYAFDGERPGPRWHAHGWFARFLFILTIHRLERIVLRKRRWRDPTTGQTRSSRSPAECGAVSFSALVIVVALWRWLDGEAGLLHRDGPLQAAWQRVSGRTVQRWKARAQRWAMEFQQAVRRALIERSEPRPLELLSSSGLSPPAGLGCRHRADPHAAVVLWRGLALVLGGAIELDVPATLLLAEARGRGSRTDSLPI